MVPGDAHHPLGGDLTGLFGQQLAGAHQPEVRDLARDPVVNIGPGKIKAGSLVFRPPALFKRVVLNVDAPGVPLAANGGLVGNRVRALGDTSGRPAPADGFQDPCFAGVGNNERIIVAALGVGLCGHA